MKGSFAAVDSDFEEHSWVLRQLSGNALALAGFSLTSLAFTIGFLGMSVPLSVTRVLLLCTVTFTVAGEMATVCKSTSFRKPSTSPIGQPLSGIVPPWY